MSDLDMRPHYRDRNGNRVRLGDRVTWLQEGGSSLTGRVVVGPSATYSGVVVVEFEDGERTVPVGELVVKQMQLGSRRRRR